MRTVPWREVEETVGEATVRAFAKSRGMSSSVIGNWMRRGLPRQHYQFLWNQQQGMSPGRQREPWHSTRWREDHAVTVAVTAISHVVAQGSERWPLLHRLADFLAELAGMDEARWHALYAEEGAGVRRRLEEALRAEREQRVATVGEREAVAGQVGDLLHTSHAGAVRAALAEGLQEASEHVPTPASDPDVGGATLEDRGASVDPVRRNREASSR